MSKMYQLITDGCHKHNVGGWAYEIDGTIKSGAIKGGGNNRMELIAVIKGLESISEPSVVTVLTDSVYVIARSKKLKRNHNEPLVLRLHELLETHHVTFVRVKSVKNTVHHKAREAMFHEIHLHLSRTQQYA